MELQDSLLAKLSSKGILAYVAVSLAGHTEASTAALAGLVKAQTTAMLEGLKELAVEAPTLLRKASGKKWSCGVIQAGEGQISPKLDSSDLRRKEFLDDVKKIFEWANHIPFTMNGADGLAVQKFLRQHKEWDRQLWQRALRNRFLSEVSHSQPLYLWLPRLVEYLASPLDRYGKPMEGNGKHGETNLIRRRNREAVEQAVSRVGQ